MGLLILIQRLLFPRRPRLQYGLRSLLLLTLFLCLALGYWAQSAHRQRAAIAAVEAAGGEVTYRTSPFDLGTADSDDPFADPPPSPFASRLRLWLAITAQSLLPRDYYQGVEAVAFDGSDDTAPVLNRLSDLGGLQRLSLPHAVDEDMLAIGKLTHLRSLDLRFSALTDAGLAHLSSLSRLQQLNLSRQGISDAGLPVVAGMPELEVLDLTGANVTGQGLPLLQDLKQLRELSLWGAALTDADIPSIAAFPALQSVNLSNTAITQDGLVTHRSLRPMLRLGWFETADIPKPTRPLPSDVWTRGLEVVDEYHSHYPFRISWMRGRCHTALGMLDHASADYIEALESIQVPGGSVAVPSVNTSYRSNWRIDIWNELCAQPAVFDRVAERRPDDSVRWQAAAWRHILEGQWSQVVEDYDRAIECTHDWRIVFDGALARLAAGDTPGLQAILKQAFQPKQTVDGVLINWIDDDQWELAASLWLFCPSGTVCLPGLTERITDQVIVKWRSSGLGPLAQYRLGDLRMVTLSIEPSEWRYGGRFWFVQAMAHGRLGNAQKAWQCYGRAVRWLARAGKIARLQQDHLGAWMLVEGEALRREAERLLFK